MGIFGSIMRTLFGGSKQTSSSSSDNQAYPFLSQTFGPTAGYTGQGGGALAAMLGLGGYQGAQDAAFENFRDNSGYDFLFDEGMRAVRGNQAARGLYHSGSTLKALQDRGMQLANTSVNSYMDRLMGLSDIGLRSGALLAGAGGRSQSQGKGTSSEGIAGSLGSILAMIGMSDERTKTDVKKIGKLDMGLPLYSYRYKGTKGRQIGVMAQDVATKAPDALGDFLGPFMTVDYGKLAEIA